jgi:hypothetical protein
MRAERESQSNAHITIAVQHLAMVSALRGDPKRAARLAGYPDAAYKNAGNQREPTEQQGYDRLMSSIRERLTEEELGSLLAEGAAMAEDEATEEAMRV